jgi:uncharacterized protein (DUF2249 family)/hemerythrin-like domain-containing protein
VHTTTVDLCDEPPARVQAAAFAALRDLAPGRTVVLLTAQEPALMLESLDLQLGHRLVWTVTDQGGRWRVEVRHRADAAPRDVFDLLRREHVRLDHLLAQALRLLDRGEAAEARAVFARFARMIAAHVRVENDLLAPFFAGAGTAAAAAAAMVREHASVMEQVALLESSLAPESADAAEASAFCALLAATLAKHEHREENELFPLWRAAWAAKSAPERERMMRRVEAALAPPAGGD